jgi:hypothetical protein
MREMAHYLVVLLSVAVAAVVGYHSAPHGVLAAIVLAVMTMGC